MLDSQTLAMMAEGTGATLYMTLMSTLFGYILGLPMGIILVVTAPKGLRPNQVVYRILDVIVNITRSIPFLILMILIMPFTRILVGKTYGTTATIVPLALAAAPFIARMVESSLLEVDHGVIEAAQSMGATPLQIICKVMIPESVPSLIQNVTIALTTILSYSAMSGIIGGGGLGKIAIDYGYYRYKYLVMFAAVVLLIILVQIFQSLGTHLATKSDKRLKK